jgi:hypothetical protein
MWIKGRRRGGAKDLSDHLQKTDENESVAVREIEGFTFDGLTGKNLEKALRQMEAIGYGKGAKRNLFHTIIAPAYGETLNVAQQRFMVEYYAEHMSFKGHQYALVEHWKNGKQHFHLVFNIIDPVSGKTHELKWTKQKEWRISRGLEEIFGLSTTMPKGKASRTWETQRGKRTGTDPRRMRKEVTAIFHASKSGQEFIKALDKAGYVLTRGNRGQLALVDRFGDTHGLMRRIEGKTIADLRKKFSGIETMAFPSHAELVNARKAAKTNNRPRTLKFIDPKRVREDVRRAYRASKTDAAFFAALNKEGYSVGRGLKGFAVIDSNGDRRDMDRLLGREAAKGLGQKFPDLSTLRPRPVSEIIRRIKTRKSGGRSKAAVGGQRSVSAGRTFPTLGDQQSVSTARKSLLAAFISAARITSKPDDQTQKNFVPVRPKTGRWPEAAVIDWETWGHRSPPKFFAKWPELKS